MDFPGQLRLPVVLLIAALAKTAQADPSLREQLSHQPFKIAYETYVNDNWEIFVMNADGSNPVNLTQTPNQHEHYPQVSPDGTKICFSVDQGEGRDAVRSLYVMDSDGRNRKKLVDSARERGRDAAHRIGTTVFRVLADAGVKNVPRQSDEICRWVMRRTGLREA